MRSQHCDEPGLKHRERSFRAIYMRPVCYIIHGDRLMMVMLSHVCQTCSQSSTHSQIRIVVASKSLQNTLSLLASLQEHQRNSDCNSCRNSIMRSRGDNGHQRLFDEFLELKDAVTTSTVDQSDCDSCGKSLERLVLEISKREKRYRKQRNETLSQCCIHGSKVKKSQS